MARDVAGAGVVAGLVFGPWAFGGTPPWVGAVLAMLAGIVVAFWLWSLWPAGGARLPWPMILCGLLLLSMGWWMALHPVSSYDATSQAFVAAQPTRSGPGAVDGATAVEFMLPITAALLAMVVVADLARRAKWRRRLHTAMVAVAASIAMFGLVQKTGLVTLVTDPMHPESVFGMFSYHGNAASFLVMTLPLAMAGAWSAASRSTHLTWAAASAILALALAVNVSKAGLALGILIFVAMASAAAIASHRSRNPGDREPAPADLVRSAARQTPKARGHWPKVVSATIAVSVLVGIGIVAAGPRWAAAMNTFNQDNTRLILWRIAAPMAIDAGWFGYGPGSFKLLMPISEHFDPRLYRNAIVTLHTPGEEVSKWSFACNDYLQGLIEWGWLGTAAWAVLIGGGLWTLLRIRGHSPDNAALAVAVVVSLAAMLLHAAVDSPFQIASIQFYIGVLLGLAWSSGHWEDSLTCASS